MSRGGRTTTRLPASSSASWPGRRRTTSCGTPPSAWRAHLAVRRRMRGHVGHLRGRGRSLREPYGGESRSTRRSATLLAAPGAGIYVDCLHFDPPFFARLAALDPGGDWAERADRGGGRLRGAAPGSARSGLFAHFWLERTGAAYGLGWGRGQGWALLGLLDVLAATARRTSPAVASSSASAGRLVRGDAGRAARRTAAGWRSSTTRERRRDLHGRVHGRSASCARLAWASATPIGSWPPPSAPGRRRWPRSMRAACSTGVSAAVYSSTRLSHYRACHAASTCPGARVRSSSRRWSGSAAETGAGRPGGR